MSTIKAYLTIDDSPTSRTPDLVDFLVERNIPALLFCRGDQIEKHMDAASYAVQKGMVLGNHSYGHKPAGDMGFDAWCADFEKAESLINDVYNQTGIERSGHYYRFPYIDRGDGVRVERFFASGNIPTDFKVGNNAQRIQQYLKEHGFGQPFSDVKHFLYQHPVFVQAADCLFTYSSADWMLTQRHLERDWPYKTRADLIKKIDQDEMLNQTDRNHVILMHDQEEITDHVIALIDHLCTKNVAFLDFKSG